jgi:hypothetical protein
MAGFKSTFASCAIVLTGISNASAGALLSHSPGQKTAAAVIRFDDKLGKGLDWSKSLPCGSNHASVTLNFKRAYSNESNMPVAKIWLHAAKTVNSPETWIAAAFSAPTDVHKLNAIEWLEKVQGSDSEGPGYAPADLNGPLHIDLSWNKAGVVSVSFGDNIVKHVTSESPITEIGLSVSWANFEFSDLKIERVGKEDIACSNATPLPQSANGLMLAYSNSANGVHPK